MQITPAIKGQLTKAIKAQSTGAHPAIGVPYAVRNIFAKFMPREQAKHAARNYLLSV